MRPAMAEHPIAGFNNPRTGAGRPNASGDLHWLG